MLKTPDTGRPVQGSNTFKKSILNRILLLLTALLPASAFAGTITGNIQLPSGVASDDFETNITVRYYASDGSEIGGRSVQQVIRSGSASVGYSIEFTDIPGGFLRLNYDCIQCPNITRPIFYTPDGVVYDRDEALLPQADVPANIDLTLITARYLSGDLIIPHDVASGDMRVSISWEGFNGGVLEPLARDVQLVTIPSGEAQLPIELSMPPVPVDYLVLYYRCFSNCDGVLPYSYYYTPGGVVFSAADAQVAPGDMPNSAVLPLLVQRMSGRIELPQGTADGDIDVSAQVTFGATFNGTIPSGQSGVDYELNTRPIDSGEYIVRYGCENNCGDLQSRTWYTLQGPQSSPERAGIPPDALPAEQDLVLIDGDQVFGNLLLPNVFAEDVGTYVSITAYAANHTYLGYSETEVNIRAGDTFAGYSLIMPKVSADYYLLRYGCRSNCGSLLETLFWEDQPRKTWLTSQIGSFEVSKISGPPVDLELQEGDQVQGKVTLPEGPAVGDVTVLVTAQARTSTGAGIGGSRDELVVIPDGETEQTFSVTLPDGDADFYLIRYGCFANCGSLLTAVYYQPGGFTENDYDGLLEPDELPDFAELPLVSGQTLSGEIQLPTGTAAQDMGFSLQLSLLSPGGGWLFVSTESFTIPAGADSVPYEFVYPDISIDSIQLRYICTSNCGTFMPIAYFTPNGPVLASDAGQVDFDELPAGDIDLVLVPGTTASGIVRLPSGLATEDMTVRVYVNAYTIGGEFMYQTSTEAIIATNFATANYQVLYETTDVGYFTLQVECQEGCDGFVETLFATPSGNAYAGERLIQQPSVQVPVAQFPVGADIALARGVPVNLEVRIPETKINTPFGQWVLIEVDAFNPGGVLLGTQLFRLVISPNEFSKTEQRHLLSVVAGGSYEVRFECYAPELGGTYARCDGLQEGAPSYTLTIPEDDIPDPILMELLPVEEECLGPSCGGFFRGWRLKLLEP